MTTKNIVPRATDEGQLGTSLKRWNQVHAKQIFLNGTELTPSGGPISNELPTVEEKAALVGSSGAPSASNLYITQQDPINTNARDPLPHAHLIDDIAGLQTTLDNKVETTDPRLNNAGEPSLFTARNSTGVTILKGQAVYISGAQSSTPRVSLAQANSENTMACIGLASTDISNNSTGNIITLGKLEDINTVSFSEGDVLYVSEVFPGLLTNIKPTVPPNYPQIVAYVTNAHISNGSVLVVQTAMRGNLEGTNNATFNIGSNQAVLSNDSRLTDARVPLTHTHIGVYEPANSNIQSHVLSAHAPSNATANSTDATLLNRSNHTGTQAQSTIVNLITDLASKETTSNKGIANGYAPLDATGKVPIANLPASGGSNYRTLVVISADVSNTTTTLQNATGLSFPVTAGVITRFEAMIYYTSAATATGSRWTLTGPTTTALMYTSEYTLTSTTSTRNARVQGYGLPSTANATSASGANMAQLEGFIIPSVTGTVTIQFASEVGGSAITAKVGSSLEYW